MSLVPVLNFLLGGSLSPSKSHPVAPRRDATGSKHRAGSDQPPGHNPCKAVGEPRARVVGAALVHHRRGPCLGGGAEAGLLGTFGNGGLAWMLKDRWGARANSRVHHMDHGLLCAPRHQNTEPDQQLWPIEALRAYVPYIIKSLPVQGQQKKEIHMRREMLLIK